MMNVVHFFHCHVSMVLRRHTWPTVFVASSMSLVVSVCVHPTWQRLSSHRRLGQLFATAFSVAAPRTWNRLPASVEAATSLSTFHQELKSFLFRSSYMDITINLFHPPFSDHQHIFYWLAYVNKGATTVGTRGDWSPQLLGWGTNNVMVVVFKKQEISQQVLLLLSETQSFHINYWFSPWHAYCLLGYTRPREQCCFSYGFLVIV